VNILIVNSKYPPEYAGSALRAHNTYLRLREKYAINVKVLCSSIEFNSSQKYSLDGISVQRIANKIELNGSRYSRILKKNSILHKIARKYVSLINVVNESIPTMIYLIKNYKWIDMIHVFGNVTVTSTAIIFSKFTKIPILIELVNLVETPSFSEPKILSFLIGSGYPKHAKFVAISVALKNACIRAGIESSSIWCRPNPVNEEKFHYNRCSVNNRYNNLNLNKKQDVTILHLAKFMPLKNQIFLLGVMKILPINYKLILAGPSINSGPFIDRDKEYLRQIINEVENYELSDRVDVLAAFITNPSELMASVDVFVFPSKREALGTPVLEAIACGLPVVTSDIPGVFDQWVHEGINGFTCILDQELWADRIVKASQISKTSLQKASANILKVASTEVIDAQYYDQFRNIIS
jgi:glycosyltransferase involved in cell wall biosynthesis